MMENQRRRWGRGRLGGAWPGKGSQVFPELRQNGSCEECKPQFYWSGLFTVKPPAQRTKGPVNGEGGWHLETSWVCRMPQPRHVRWEERREVALWGEEGGWRPQDNLVWGPRSVLYSRR